MSVLQTISPSRKIRPPRMVLLGGPKVGKSTFAAGFSKPIFLPVEKEEGIDDVDAEAFPVSSSFDEVIRYANALANEDHEYKTFVIDSASALNPLIVRRAMEIEKVDTEAKLGGGFGRQHDTVLNLWSQLLTTIDAMRDKQMTTIIIGHITSKRFEDPINGGYTATTLIYLSQLQSRFSVGLTRSCSQIGTFTEPPRTLATTRRSTEDW